MGLCGWLCVLAARQTHENTTYVSRTRYMQDGRAARGQCQIMYPCLLPYHSYMPNKHSLGDDAKPTGTSKSQHTHLDLRTEQSWGKVAR